MKSTNTLEDDIDELKKYIKYYPDFPKPGIIYKDVLSLLNNAEGIQLLEKILNTVSLQFMGKIDCIVMLESRGFMFGPKIALQLCVPCIPICKKGNLPGPVIEQSYVLEYGVDILTVQLNSIKKGQRILLVDDFLATGGTLEAAKHLIHKCGGEIVQGLVLMEKCELEGRKRLNFPIISLISE